MSTGYRCERGCTDKKQCHQISPFRDMGGSTRKCNQMVCEHDYIICEDCQELMCINCAYGHYLSCGMCHSPHPNIGRRKCYRTMYKWDNKYLCGNTHICGKIIGMDKKIKLLETENQHQREEIIELKEENTELKYRPPIEGGEGYMSAKTDFEKHQ